eukprot:CAMPEP_0119311234 /NCGR_PEP_ID=MMETSP1333-20130426/21987_1 /TAXON_ID=418940 /ORGANISM="Scyphosphaera apsteinii, Strain RCC1455" /LENGTH=363 /DNA_ID=CAMNT_0007315565 /DNA_START=10 /DNA_END=1102 /DNA_ORIENTATION=+
MKTVVLAIAIATADAFSPIMDSGSVTSTSHTVPHLGNVKLVCDHSEKAAPKLYLEVDTAAWEALGQVMTGLDVSLPAPPDCPPFKHALVTYGIVSQTHPPWDGRQFNGEKPGGYGQPHVDIHFMVKSIEEQEALTSTCTTVDPGPTNSAGALIQCSETATDEATRKFFIEPPPDQVTGFAQDTSFGNHAIIGHGLHLMPLSDLAPGGPAHCQSTGPEGSWVDCMNQFMGVVMGGDFVDQGCTCGPWTDGMTAILNVYNGEVLGNEVMPAIGIVRALGSGALPNPYLEEYPTAGKYSTSGYQPVATYSYLNADAHIFRTGLVQQASTPLPPLDHAQPPNIKRRGVITVRPAVAFAHDLAPPIKH